MRRLLTMSKLSLTLVFFLIAGLLFGLLISSCVELPEDRNIAIIGDSMIAAGRSNSSGVGARLTLMIGEEIMDHSESGLVIQCKFPLGCASECKPPRDCPQDIADAYSRVKADLPDLDTIVVNGGANDMVYGKQAQEVRGDIERLLQQILDDGIEMIIYARYYEFICKSNNPLDPSCWFVPPLNNAIRNVMENPYHPQRSLKQFCEDNGIIYLDLRPVFKTRAGNPRRYFYHSNIHPSGKGSFAIAREIFRNLQLGISPQICIDFDEDGYGEPASDACPYAVKDCDDNDPSVNAGAPENCSNGIDDDCDNLGDAEDPDCG
jgi:lysophospholipase L1-like esterase